MSYIEKSLKILDCKNGITDNDHLYGEGFLVEGDLEEATWVIEADIRAKYP